MIAVFLAVALVIDAAKSTAQFTVPHIFVERVTGTVPVLAGTIVLQAGSALPQSVSATLDATQIKTGDDDRDGVLQTPEWFDTKTYPRWTFVSTKITPQGSSAFSIDGNLTLRGVTNPVHLQAQIAGDPAHPRYHATGRIDRKIWGMAMTRLDPAIGNPVDVTLDIVTK